MLTEKELEEIRRKMLELEEEPPVGSWQSIQAEVRPKQKWRSWWFLPLLLLLLVGTYQLMKTGPEIGQVDKSQVASTQIPSAKRKLKNEKVNGEQPVAPVPPVPESNIGEQLAQTSVDKKQQVMQQDLQENPALTAGASTPYLSTPEHTYGGRWPQAEFILELPVISVSITSVADSADMIPRGQISKRLLPEAPILPYPDKKKARKHKTTKTRDTETPAVEKTGAEVAAVAPAKEKKTKAAAIPEKAVVEEKQQSKATPQKKQEHSRNEWTAGVYFAPRYAFRKFVPNASDDILITKVSSANQLDPERMGFEFGANYSRVLSPGLFAEGGLSWMQLKENVTYTLTTGEIDTFNVSQTGGRQIVIESKLRTEERQLVSSYAYGGLRLGATYYFMERGNSRLNITVAGGANLLIKGRTKQYSNGVWTETVEFPSVENILEQSNYNLQFGMGYNVSVLENYEVTLMPTINYFLGSTYKEREPLGLKPYSLGLNLQLKRRFNH
ncbi:hypothetical protein CLV24_108167 [Pontibacter ummariensis]|uniref:Outer membrane protein beta-barrel domain-containing protein n=1 Tax=Pontibacter ummariensis TaxID=1610492 RepID=A0A239F763_9BACT|nr:hypothetical protein [Pontibacter ummariensis]PRY12423.1 hypothetical protein CLV24_108167 [Pontibacter ummariensis]SNS52002.1 hypothetical protein SAMN06296052_10818 [Pontibacter ummariensis]